MAVRRLRQLGPRDLAYLPRAAATAAAVPVALRLLPLGAALHWVSTGAVGAGSLPAPERVVRLTDALLRLDVGPWRPSCVTRSLVLLRYLPAAGVPVVVQFGVRRGEPLLDGHAWVERDGVPWCEPKDTTTYRVMYTFPDAGRGEGVGMRLRARVFPHSHRLAKGLLARAPGGRGAVAAHSGLWLGLLSEADLQAVDEATYQGKYAYHHTDDHNLRGLFDWETAAIDRWFPASGRVLVTSAGGGREIVALRRRGLEVVGFECNAELRSGADALLARLRLGGPVLPAPRDVVPAGLPGPFDAAVVGWGALTYLRGRARRLRFLQQLGATLRPGAPVLASFYARTREARRLQLVQTLGDAVGRWLGREPLELGDVLDPVFQHYFSEDEVRSELTAAGFTVEHYAAEPFAHVVARWSPAP